MRALATAVVRRLRAEFQRVAAAEAERLLEVGRFDAIAELAEGYPLKVFGDAVGITAADRKTLLEYGNISFNAMGPRNALCLESMRNERAVTDWIMAQCARDALDPKGLGAIMYAAADEGEITQQEAGMLVRSFLSAGVDTTVRAVGGALDMHTSEAGGGQTAEYSTPQTAGERPPRPFANRLNFCARPR